MAFSTKALIYREYYIQDSCGKIFRSTKQLVPIKRISTCKTRNHYWQKRDSVV